ncbi:MAG: universal stress protein [Gammaproteobacteria bacterium]
MIKNIVLAIDGSVHAQHAQTMAIDLASKYDAQLTLVHVLTHDHPSTEFERMAKVEHLSDSGQPRVSEKENTYSAVARFLGSTNDSKDAKEARIIVLLGEQIIDKASKSAHKAGVTNITAEILSGDYANSILEVAKKADADVIVMGRRGLSNLKGFVTGSVSHKVSQRAECSVLTVK